MVRYIIKRFLISILTVWVVITATFFLMNLMPGKPYTGEKAIPKAIQENLNAKYGLDQPLITRYFIYLKNVSRGDLGMSMTYKNREVSEIIRDNFPVSADLGIRSLIFGVIAGLFLGVISALKHNRGWDSFSMLVAIIGVSLPSFIIGTMLQFGLGLKFSAFIKDLFNTDFQLFPIALWESPWHKILPSFALGLASLALVARLMRTSMLDVLNQDYIRTAKSKGLSYRTVVMRHTIRNAILPVVTILGPLSAAVLTGTFVVENIFAIPGLGKHFVQSVGMYDYTMIMGLTLFYASFLIAVNFLVDILYGIIDPRIRLAKGKI
ncbi:MAG TPA: peptide ABC transporter permease [Clostridiales bacterium]|nr:peptide ABC transporter permease [Clostridiales bacterium]